VDIGAGEHAYGQIMKALLERHITGEGKRIDISLFESAISWTATHLPVSLTCGIEVTRRGNTHQFFAPVSLFETRDGYVYLGVGNDRQWKTLIQLSEFRHLDQPEYRTNRGRMEDSPHLVTEIAGVAARKTSQEILDLIQGAGLVAGATRTLRELEQDPLVQKRFIRARDPKTKKEIILASPPVETAFLETSGYRLSFPPRLGEHNQRILEEELDFHPKEIRSLESRRIV
jgi:formyl-CoA transferase